MFSFILNFFYQTKEKDNKKLFSDNEIVFSDGMVISAEDFSKSLLDSCNNFCSDNNNSIHVLELNDYIFKEKSTIDMHISTAITFDNIISSEYKLRNNKDQPLNFKDDLNLWWRKHVVTYICEQYIPISKIGDIAFRKDVNNDSYIKIGKVTKIGLFLCEIIEE